MASSESNEADRVTAALQLRADAFVESSKTIMQLEYDYSPKSLQIVDQALAVYHSEGFMFETGWHPHAAYAGEVVRRALGGQWVLEADGSSASLRGVGGKATIYPFLWVSKRVASIVEGSEENSLALKYVKLLQALDREAEAPEVLPTNFVRQLAESLQEETCGDSDSSEEVNPSTACRSQTDEKIDPGDSIENSLAIAPTNCFFMIAAADGNIDKKEAQSFLIEVVKYASHRNPLIREVFGNTPLRFAEYCEGISESPPVAVLNLALCRIAAQQASPEHAMEFFQALLDMSTAIASSSGGFFSRGKVSRNERQVLDIIAQTLGLKEG